MIQRSIFGLLFPAVVALAFGGNASRGQPLPCDRQRRDNAAPAIVVDKTDVATAKGNREAIEQALRNGGTVTLPAGLVAVDRGIRLVDGCTLQGAGPQTVLRNVATGAPFGDNCTLVIHPQYRDAGIGYADTFERVARSTIRFREPQASRNYPLGGWLYTYKWNGYTEAQGARTRVHRVVGKTADTLTLNSEPQAAADKAAYTTCAARISGANEGSARVRLASAPPPEFQPGRWVHITEGPTSGNECTGEFRRIVRVANQALDLDRPLRAAHPHTLALAALLTPVEAVTIRDLTVEPFNNQAPPCYFQFAENLTLQRVATAGDIQCILCSNVRLYDCNTASTINFNGTRDSIVVGGRCRHVYLEENCADCTFANLLVSGSPTAGVNAAAGSPSERITLRDVIVEQARDMPIHLVGRECVVENCTVRQSTNPVAWVHNYVGGDGTRLSNFTSDLETVFRGGHRVVVENVRSQLHLGWSGPGDQPVGVCRACPNVSTDHLSPETLAQWAFATNSTE